MPRAMSRGNEVCRLPMVSKNATITNEYGIHCRPSAVIAKEAQGYPGTIEVRSASNRRADAKSLLTLVGLGARCGDTLTISVSGPDEETMCAKMVDLFETGFDFPRPGAAASPKR